MNCNNIQQLICTVAAVSYYGNALLVEIIVSDRLQIRTSQKRRKISKHTKSKHLAVTQASEHTEQMIKHLGIQQVVPDNNWDYAFSVFSNNIKCIQIMGMTSNTVVTTLEEF